MTDPNQTHDEAPRGGIIGWWARNSVAANLLMIVAVLGGILGYQALNREVFPSASFNGATVSVAWPGASPQEIEEQIVVRIEEALADMDGIETITSTAREGAGFVNIEGKRNVDIGQFIDNVKLEVDSVNTLPPSAYRPVVSQWRNPDQVVDKLGAYQDLGVDAFIYYASMGLDMAQQKRSLATFIDRVMPQFA